MAVMRSERSGRGGRPSRGKAKRSTEASSHAKSLWSVGKDAGTNVMQMRVRRNGRNEGTSRNSCGDARLLVVLPQAVRLRRGLPQANGACHRSDRQRFRQVKEKREKTHHLRCHSHTIRRPASMPHNARVHGVPSQLRARDPTRRRVREPTRRRLSR